MKTKFVLMGFLLVFLTNCTKIPKGYEIFQTFDEYSLKGVKPNGKLKQPFVAVKYGKDTISVLICKNFQKKNKNRICQQRRLLV
jgi:hypothetical protein